MAENKKTISVEVRADGSNARRETESVARDVAAAKRKMERDVIAINAGDALGSRHFVYTADGSQALGVINGLRAELAALARDAATPIVIAAPRMAAGGVVPGRSGATTPGPTVTPPAVRRPLPLRAVDPAHRQYLSERAVKATMMTLGLDSKPALEEAEKAADAINQTGRKIKPWRLSLGGFFGGAYDKTFKGFGGDVSRWLNFGKLFGGAQSGLGKALSLASFAFTGIYKAASWTFSAVAGGLRRVGGLIKSALTMPLRLAGTAFKALGIAAAASAAGVYAGLKALRPAADMQQYQIQLEVLLKDPAKAKARLAELTKYAKDTNYGPAEIIESANLMESFGIYGDDISRLKLAGDAANAFGKDIREVVRSISYLSSGRTGEAMESLSRIGVTREKLKPFGVEFTKSGEMTTEPKKAIDAVFQYFAQAFGGMTARQAKTWKGAIQQLGGEVYDAFARGFKSALTPLTRFVTGNVIPMIDSIGKRLESVDWKKLLATPLKMLGGMTEIVTKLTDPATAAQGLKEIKGLGSDLWEGARTALGHFGGVGTALLKDLGAAFEAFVGEGGIGKTFSLAWDGLKLAMEAGAALFKTVLSGFSGEFLSGLKMALDHVPGIDTGETRKRDAAVDKANWQVMGAWRDRNPGAYWDAYSGISAKLTSPLESAKTNIAYSQYVTEQKLAGKEPVSRKDFFSKRLNEAIADFGIARDPSLRAVKDAAFHSAMGWGSRPPGDLWAGFDAQQEKLKGSFREWKGVFSSMGFGHTMAAVDALPGQLASALAPAGERLGRNARGAALRAHGAEISAQAKEYDAKAVAQLSELRKAGWQKVKRDEHGRVARDLSGKIIPFEVERHGAEAAAARQKYYALDARRRQQAAAYQAAWRKAAQGYRQASGNIVKEGAPASGGKSVGESLGQVGQGIVDVGKLLAAQQGPRRDIIDTMGRIESLLSRVLGVA